MIIETSWLQSHFGDSDLVLIDGRGKFAYNREHIKNAIPLELEDIIDVADNGSNLTIVGQKAENLFGNLGLDVAKNVVVYGEYFDPAAARMVWTLIYNGHVKTSLLDKSFTAIKRDALLPTNQVLYEPKPAKFISKPNNDVRADENFVKQRINEHDTIIIDARTKLEHIQARIHGSKLHPWINGVGENGDMLKSSKQLLADFNGAKITREKAIVCYCHSGTRAAHKFIQFKHAGFNDVRCYDGSIIDWGQRKNSLQ